MKATPEMRQVQFKLLDRIAIIPVELFHLDEIRLDNRLLLFLSGRIKP